MVIDLVGEIWRTPHRFPLYRVSNLGRIKSTARGSEKLLKATNAEISLLDKNGNYIPCQLGRLILEAFVSSPPCTDSKARHLNDDRRDSSLSNLEWGTQRDNVHDAIRNGIFAPLLNRPSEESRKKMRDAQTGRTHSVETRKKMAESGRRRMAARKAADIVQARPAGLSCAGRIWITNGVDGTLVFPTDCIPDGWRRGRK